MLFTTGLDLCMAPVAFLTQDRRYLFLPIQRWLDLAAQKREQRFKSVIGHAVRETGLGVEVFIWDDFHDRYLVSNLIGILIPNGFDIEKNPSITRWAGMHRLEHRFML